MTLLQRDLFNSPYSGVFCTTNDVLTLVPPGIPKDEYENVFKPFYKIDKSRGDSKSSVGLGLSIANDIIKSHGGDIDFDKSKLGGLKAKISLPF